VHIEFADWFRVASIDPKDVDLKVRWDGVEAHAKDISTDDLLDAARLFYGLPQKDREFLTRFRGPFKAADDKFAMKDNDAELRVLAGATLVAHLNLVDWDDVAALALTCGSFRDQRPAAVGDIVRIAREHLSAKSASLREPKHPTLPKNDFTAQIQGMRQAFQGAAAPSQLADPVCNTFQTWSKLFEAMIQWTEIQEQQQSLYREESNILWWLFAEQSRDLRQPLAQLKSPAVALVASKEMADLTVTVPGPFSARAFLAKALRLAQKPSKDVTLAAAIAACPAEWNKVAVGHADFTKLDDLCPVSVALRKFVEVDGADTWTNAFKGATGLTATEKLDPVDLAEQAYEEWLLARACRKLYSNK